MKRLPILLAGTLCASLLGCAAVELEDSECISPQQAHRAQLLTWPSGSDTTRLLGAAAVRFLEIYNAIPPASNYRGDDVRLYFRTDGRSVAGIMQIFADGCRTADPIGVNKWVVARALEKLHRGAAPSAGPVARAHEPGRRSDGRLRETAYKPEREAAGVRSIEARARLESEP